jgi:hypothetical protein
MATAKENMIYLLIVHQLVRGHYGSHWDTNLVSKFSSNVRPGLSSRTRLVLKISREMA